MPQGESWFYRVHRPRGGDEIVYVRYRLRVTEDQRQVCTGRGLRYGVINDDCETSGMYAVGEEKTAGCMKSMMLREGFIDDGDLPPTNNEPPGAKGRPRGSDRAKARRGAASAGQASDHKSRDEAFYSLVEKLVDSKKNSAMYERMRGIIKKYTGGKTEEDIYTFMALANILRQFDFSMDLVIGTANAAAVGAAAQLSGHCYAMCTGYHHRLKDSMRMIVEGTRWVTQASPTPLFSPWASP